MYVLCVDDKETISGIFDERDQLWKAVYETYYDTYFEEILSDKLISYWQLLDEGTKILVALTATGSAISGWTLWSTTGFKSVWIFLAGFTALLAILHSTLGVPNRLQDWGEIKRFFAVLRIDIESFRYRMTVNPNFAIDDSTKEFTEYRRRYGDGIQRLKNDILWTKRVEYKAQNDLNERLKNNAVVSG